jgi:hypothetical protein
VIFIFIAAAIAGIAYHGNKFKYGASGKIVYADYYGALPQIPIITRQSVNDYQCLPNPGSPPTGYIRLYCDSTTGQLTTITSTGTATAIGSSGFSITSFGATSGRAVIDGTMTTTNATFTANGNSTSPATPAGTTTFNNEVVVSAYAINAAFTPPGTPTSRGVVASSAGNHTGLWMGDQSVASAGAYGANTGTISSSPWAVAAIPLIPKAGQTITFTTSTTASSSGATTSLNVSFSATAGQTMLACVSGFNGTSFGGPSGWSFIVNAANTTQQLTCWAKQAGSSEPGSYIFSGKGQFISVVILEYANVAAIDAAITSATANFTQADVGKIFCAQGFAAAVGANLPGGSMPCTTLNLVSNGTTVYSLVMNTQAGTISNGGLMLGTDNTAAFTSAATAVSNAGGGTLQIPAGIWFLNAGNLNFPWNVVMNIQGVGVQGALSYGTPVVPGGSFVIGLPDSSNDPIIGTTTGPGTGLGNNQIMDFMTGVTIRSTETGTGPCIKVAMEFFTLSKSALVGCGGDGIQFTLNNLVYTGLGQVLQNQLNFLGGYGVDLPASTLPSNFIIDGNDMNYNLIGGIAIAGQQQVRISNNQLQFFTADAINITGTTSTAIAIGPSNWINSPITYSTASVPGADIFDNYFELAGLIKFNGTIGPKVTGNFFAVAGNQFAGGSTQTNITMDATNQGANFTTSFNGTSGTAACTYGIQGGQTRATCFLNGYANTGAAQTWTYPLANATSPFLTESGGSCGSFNPSTSATVLTLPANAGMTAETCQIVVIGQTN